MDALKDYENLLKMQKDPENQTPLQREYNALVGTPSRLRQAVVVQMHQMIGKQIAPTWENFEKTKTWMVLSMNITNENRLKYEAEWQNMYKLLMETPNGDEQSVPTPASNVGGNLPRLAEAAVNENSDSAGNGGAAGDSVGSNPADASRGEDSGVQDSKGSDELPGVVKSSDA